MRDQHEGRTGETCHVQWIPGGMETLKQYFIWEVGSGIMITWGYNLLATGLEHRPRDTIWEYFLDLMMSMYVSLHVMSYTRAPTIPVPSLHVMSSTRAPTIPVPSLHVMNSTRAPTIPVPSLHVMSYTRAPTIPVLPTTNIQETEGLGMRLIKPLLTWVMTKSVLPSVTTKTFPMTWSSWALYKD